MRKNTYIKLINAISSNRQVKSLICTASKLITASIYIAYPALLAWLLALGFTENQAFFSTAIQAFSVPAISFVLTSILRNAVNAQRPYEVLNIKPAISKKTKGKSFPSRHTFSIFVIGVTFCACCPMPAIGCVVLALGVCLAVLRVLAGVHFVRDVVAGAVLGIACGVVGFWIL